MNVDFLIIILSAILLINASRGEEETAFLNAPEMKTKNQWRIVNDGVMGGLSSSKALIENNKIIFSGNVSLKNNGGFASLRSPVKDYNFLAFTGIELKIKTDGKRYSISTKETPYFTGYFYTASFETKADEWMTIKLPFNQFKLYYFGRRINDSSEIPLDKIKEISFLIGDKQEGDFVAEIDYIKLY